MSQVCIVSKLCVNARELTYAKLLIVIEVARSQLLSCWGTAESCQAKVVLAG